jgi:predicted Rossmann fold flavoprotein
MEPLDLAIIGAGAAGLAAGIFAGEAAAGRGLRIAAFDGARKPGAKILVSGGGRCNVTNEKIRPEDYCGGSPVLIRNVLRAFDEHRTRAWLESLGVALKLEPTGKWFPVSDSARTVLDALLRRLAEVGTDLRASHRVAGISREGDRFRIAFSTGQEAVLAWRVVMATGGLALPKSGSDGWGLELLRSMGHRIIPTTPALVPLVLGANGEPGGRFAELSGLTVDARLDLVDEAGRKLHSMAGSLLFTHFGISGPVAMNLSRHWLRERLEGRRATLRLSHPAFPSAAQADGWLRAHASRQHTPTAVGGLWPERLARVLADDTDRPLATLRREERLRIAERLAALPLPVTGERGYPFAETTAGGVDLAEVDVRTMESRIVPGLHLCGELLDVDGRIGGFNFQWAWATGYLAGRGAVAPR